MNMTKLIVAFRNYANAPKMTSLTQSVSPLYNAPRIYENNVIFVQIGYKFGRGHPVVLSNLYNKLCTVNTSCLMCVFIEGA